MPRVGSLGGTLAYRPARLGDSSSSARASEHSQTLPVISRIQHAREGSPFAKDQEPITRALPSSLRGGSIRSVFHHQGLARLGATPFRDAVTSIGKGLLVCALRDVPALR